MEAFDSAGVTGIVRRRVAPGHEARAEAVMRGIMALARQAEGFLGSEIFPPIPGVQDAYVVLYRYDSGANLRKWLASPRRQELLAQIEGELVEPAVEFFFVHGRRHAGTASSVFAYRVRRDREAEFQQWRRRILEEVRKWEGFLGTESFDTIEGAEPEFIVVVRFDSRARLDAWLQSPVRKIYMDEVSRYVDHYTLRRIGSGFEGWFDLSENNPSPARWRQALLILSALFPVIMVMRHLLWPVFHMLPLPAAYLLLLAVDVVVLAYLVMPHYSGFMSFWLRPGPAFTWRRELAGLGIAFGIIGLTLVVALLAA